MKVVEVTGTVLVVTVPKDATTIEKDMSAAESIRAKKEAKKQVQSWKATRM